MATLNFTAEDWDRVRQNTMAWWADELPRPLIYLTTTDPVPPARRYDFLTNYPMSVSAEEIVDRHAPVIEATHYYGDAFPWWWMNFGPGIMAGFLGGDVHSVAEPSETVWFSVPEVLPIGELDFTFDPVNVWWQRVKAVTAAVADRWDGMVQVGHTDLGGNLDILASFRDTERLLYEVMDRPEEVDRLVHQITRLWLQYYDEQQALVQPLCPGTSCWTPIWSPDKTYMLQCDFSYMISPAMFERFVMPDLVACCDHLDHGFYHLDGKGEIPHLDLLLSIERLRGIQWIPGDGQPPPHMWLPLLKRIRDGVGGRDGGKLCQVFVSPEGALTIVRNLGGRGFFFVIQAGPGEFSDGDGISDPAQVTAFLKLLHDEDVTLAQ